MSLLSIDQSTSSTTAFLFDDTGQGREILSLPHRQIYPAPGHVEHDPNELLTNVTTCLTAGRAAGATAVALSNQGESCLAWDAATGTPLSPVLVWQDSRTADRCAAVEDAAKALVATRAGLPLDPYFSASKLAWILREIPEAQTLAQHGRLRLGTTDAFFRDRLGAGHCTDVATASRTALMTLATGQWDPALCALFGVPLDALPAITDTSGDLGTLGGLSLRAAIVDQQAALYGHGVRAPGEAKVTFGTGAFALALAGTTAPAYTGGALPTVAWRAAGQSLTYALDGGVHTASSALNWARALGLFQDFSDLSFTGHALARGLAFVPALAGLACPHWDDRARGTWLGLGLDTSRQDMVQALLEGVLYRTREVLATMDLGPGVLRIDGGLTRSPWLCQALANITGHPVTTATSADLTAYGAAWMAAQSLGQTWQPMAPSQTYHPDPDFSPLPDRFAEARRIAAQWGTTAHTKG